MSRFNGENYDEEWNNQWELWEANTLRHMRGPAGQAILRELREALLALPERKLINSRLADEQGCVCTIGALALHRGRKVEELAALIPAELWDEYEEELKTEALGRELGLKHVMIVALAGQNDDTWRTETPEQRFERVLKWVESEIQPEPAGA